jgi:hypothetical protein
MEDIVHYPGRYASRLKGKIKAEYKSSSLRVKKRENYPFPESIYGESAAYSET